MSGSRRPARRRGTALRSLAGCSAALLLLSSILSAASPPVTAHAQGAPVQRAAPASPYDGYIAEASRRFGIRAAWIRAVMRVESAGNVRALSSAGAMGLMQIMPATWVELSARHGLGGDVYDPRDNILAGAAYLREMYDRYGSPGFLAAYNAGPSRYEEHLAGRPLPAETRAYLAKLAPLVGGGDITMSLSVAAVDPDAWMRAPLFVDGAEDTATVDPMQFGGRSEDAPRVAPVSDPSAIAPQPDGLFVARQGARRPQ